MKSNFHSLNRFFENGSDADRGSPRSLKFERHLPTDDAADFLGITTGALLTRTWRGEIIPKKLGRLNRYAISDLERLLRAQTELPSEKKGF